MASYLILGAGKFGRLAAERLTALDPKARLLVVDRDPEALKAARAGASGELDAVAAEAVSYLARHLSRFAAWDWLIPMVPGHVALGVLRQGPLAPSAWEMASVPEAVESLAEAALRGPAGEMYLSRAAHLCPDDCPESADACPVTGEPRSPALYEALEALQLPGWRLVTIVSRLLAPGVGGYPPRLLLELAAAAPGFPEKVLLATACRCHGVVHALNRVKGAAV